MALGYDDHTLTLMKGLPIYCNVVLQRNLVTYQHTQVKQVPNSKTYVM